MYVMSYILENVYKLKLQMSSFCHMVQCPIQDFHQQTPVETK